MEFIAILFVALLVLLLIPVKTGEIPDWRKRKQDGCVPHKWTYNHEDKLQCCECGLVAGEIKSNKNDY